MTAAAGQQEAPGNQPLIALDNIGFQSSARHFAGFSSIGPQDRLLIEPRQLASINLCSGDLIQIAPVLGAHCDVLAVALNDDASDNNRALGLAGDQVLPADSVDMAPLAQWLRTRSAGSTNKLRFSKVQSSAAQQPVLRASASCTVWVANPVTGHALVDGKSQGTVLITVSRATDHENPPAPLGDIAEEIFVPRATARSYQLRRGQKLQIIDLQGQQCSDFQALTTRELDAGKENTIDSTATRTMVRHAFPRPGLLDKYFDGNQAPMLRVVRDTCGRHDTFGVACTARGYEERGFPGHVNCSDNISNALAPFGVRRRLAWPAINLFWNTWINPHHQIMTEESWSRPGDYIVLEALQDLVCVSTACPDDIDPINGWNPTDILVRIYNSDQKITRAVAYREKEDQPMLISEESAFHPRLAPLTEHFAPARDLWTPVSFPATGAIGEYWACRDKVTVQDMSGLRKYDIIGPDATRLLQLATTRNVEKLAHWRGQYTLMCDETGAVIDDGTLFRLGPDLFRWCCGNEESGRALQELAAREGLQVRINPMRNALPNLAVQGPNSRELIRRICFTQPHVPNIEQLKWFGVTVARLHDRDGVPFMLSRSGYTGELGYELFCARADAVALWDAVFEAGQDLGVVPMGSEALETIRIEAGLAAANAEFGPGVNAFEAGLGFAVNLDKTNFIGKSALARGHDNPVRVLKGLRFNGDDVPPHGAPVFAGERQIGVITSATRSPLLESTIAMARLAVEYSDNGQQLEVGQLDGRMKRLPATVANSPFVDPQREKPRA